jgi:hypothetical protein
MINETFYMVWNTAGGMPRKRHKTEEEAVEEASRLANQNIGTFYVFKACVMVETGTPIRTNLREGEEVSREC